MKENVNYIELFKQLPHLAIDYNAEPVKGYREGFNRGFEVVDDWAYTPNLYHFDTEWHLSWIHCSEGDGIIDFRHPDSPEDCIMQAYEFCVKNKFIEDRRYLKQNWFKK